MAGLVGAFAGTFVAAVNYYLVMGVLERARREREQTLTAEERDRAETTWSLIRRIILTVDIFAFAAVGYWLGKMFWD
jgi:hypothetical protein